MTESYSQNGSSSKLNWKKIEIALNRFFKITEVDLEKLNQHKKNILVYENSGNRSAVHHELAKANQTMEQLRANVLSIEKLRNQIDPKDHEKFDLKLDSCKTHINEIITNFRSLDSDWMEYVSEDFYQLLQQGPVTSTDKCQAQKVLGLDTTQMEGETALARENAEMAEGIERDMNDVKDMMDTLSSMIHAQGEKVDSIEDNVESAHSSVTAGGSLLSKAAKYKAAGIPLVTAAVGALVGGPVGLMAGIKVGMLAAGAGGTVGLLAGKKIKSVQNHQNEVELQNLHAASDMAETRMLRNAATKSNTDGE